jgi:hypothetical protein
MTGRHVITLSNVDRQSATLLPLLGRNGKSAPTKNDTLREGKMGVSARSEGALSIDIGL